VRAVVSIASVAEVVATTGLNAQSLRITSILKPHPSGRLILASAAGLDRLFGLFGLLGLFELFNYSFRDSQRSGSGIGAGEAEVDSPEPYTNRPVTTAHHRIGFPPVTAIVAPET
jgi:hypothetical protein